MEDPFLKGRPAADNQQFRFHRFSATPEAG